MVVGFVWEALQMTKIWSCELSVCSAGVAIAKYWKGCGLSIKHSRPGTASWNCVFRSAGLASALACDRQQNHFIHPSASEGITGVGGGGAGGATSSPKLLIW